MRILEPVLALCLAQSAFAQPPEVPAEVRDMIRDIAQEFGLTPYGDVFMSQLDDEDSETIEVKVAPDKLTYINVEGNDDTLDIRLRAMAGSKEIVPEFGSVLQIPPGNGDKVTVEVSMSCDYISCGYFVQTFVR